MSGADAMPPPAITCEVQTQKSKKKLSLTGRIDSPVPAAGTYRFVIEKEGPGGSSRVAQSGNFSIGTNLPATAGQATIDFSRGTRVTVRMSGEALGREFSCNLDEVSDE